MKFLPYQDRWIKDQSRLKILEKSRRIGGTYGTSYGQFQQVLRHNHHDIVAVTRDENLAAEFILDVSQWARMWNAIQPVSLQIPERCFKTLSLEIPHPGGKSRVIAVSSNPNAAIGRGGDLVLDEFAAHKDPELLLRLAQPIMMAGGSISILSTHRGRTSKFNEIIKEARNDPESEWSVHKTTIIDAINQGLVEQVVNPKLIKLGREPWETREDFLAWLKRTYDEHTFNQEFMCIPSEEATSLFSVDEIEQAFTLLELEGPLKRGMFYMGYDCAESIHGDFAAWCVLRHNMIDNHVEMVDKKYFERGTSINEQIEDVVSTAKKYHVAKLVSDNAGIGRHPTTILGEKLGGHMVVEFNPTIHSKSEMCTKAKRWFQNGWFRMQKDNHVRDDFLSIDRVITPSNNIVYHSNRSGNVGHGDMFSAAAMALTEIAEMTAATIKGAEKPVQQPRYDMDIIERNRMEDEKPKRRSAY